MPIPQRQRAASIRTAPRIADRHAIAADVLDESMTVSPYNPFSRTSIGAQRQIWTGSQREFSFWNVASLVLTCLLNALAVVAVVESQPADGPAWKAFQSAIRRKGKEASEAGGGDAIRAVQRAVAAAAPDEAERRDVILAVAWVGLPGWRS